MSRGRPSVRLVGLLVCACVALAPAAAGARSVAEPHPHVGRLPGFPVVRGVVPVLGSKAAVGARERLVRGAFAAARARHPPGERLLGLAGPPTANEVGQPPCVSEFEEERSFATQDVCYRGGPVLRDPRIHLIFWQGNPGGAGEEKVKPFPEGYESAVVRYFKDVARDSGAQTNVFAVDSQYGDEVTGSYAPGEYALSREVEVIDDTDSFLPSKCSDETEFSEGPCVLDADLHKEIEKYAGSSPRGFQDIYVVLTPAGVGGCFAEGECAYRAYCAYHGDFGGDGVTPGQQTLYADLPFAGKVPGCDLAGELGVHPNSNPDNGVDAAIDDASHEINETITDPIGSQCAAGAIGPSECEHNAWTDAIGQEIADKCLPPESTPLGVFGEALGGSSPSTLYNQLIGGDPYFTQREWSNEAGLGEGACVQRMIGASFSVSAGAAASVPVSFDGSTSGAPGDAAVYWVWDFEGEQLGTPSAITSHTYSAPGAYEVGLTAYDAYGNARTTVERVNVGAAPVPPSSPSPSPPPAPAVVMEPAASLAHFTPAQLAAKLGLPANGRKLLGSGPFLLGRAECPPACAVALRLYARIPSISHKHRVSTLVSVGAARDQGVPKGAVFVRSPGSLGELLLSLNAKGRALLRQRHTLSCKLVVTVEGQEGGSWQLARSLTLMR